MLKIGKSWDKIANYHPNAQQRSAALASSIPVLGLDRVCPQEIGHWPRIVFSFFGVGLEPCVLDSTSVNSH